MRSLNSIKSKIRNVFRKSSRTFCNKISAAQHQPALYNFRVMAQNHLSFLVRCCTELPYFKALSTQKEIFAYRF